MNNKKTIVPRTLFPCKSNCNPCSLNSILLDGSLGDFVIPDPRLEFIVATALDEQTTYNITLPKLIQSDPFANPEQQYITFTIIFRNISTTNAFTILVSPDSADTIFDGLTSLSLPAQTTIVLKSVGNVWFRII